MPCYQHKAQAYSPLGFLKDHFHLTTEIFNLYGAYLGCNSIDPKLNESVMITVNSVNECPYCTILHTEGAANVAGIDGAKLQCAKTEAEARQASIDSPAITFAHVFGETGGYGPDKDAAYAKLVELKGTGFAKSIHALCRYMMWGGRTGNTIQGFLCGSLLCNPRPDRHCLFVPIQVLFEFLVVTWYSILFLVLIPVVGKVFKYVFPTGKLPDCLNGLIGCVLVTVAGSHIVPMGIIGGVLYPLQLCCNKAPPKKAPKGCKAKNSSAADETKEEPTGDVEAPKGPQGTAIP